MTRENSRLPRHMPPMNVPSSTPIDTADDPMTNSSSWNQTTSYMRAAHPLPTNNSRSTGSRRREFMTLLWVPDRHGRSASVRKFYLLSAGERRERRRVAGGHRRPSGVQHHSQQRV